RPADPEGLGRLLPIPAEGVEGGRDDLPLGTLQGLLERPQRCPLDRGEAASPTCAPVDCPNDECAARASSSSARTGAPPDSGACATAARNRSAGRGNFSTATAPGGASGRSGRVAMTQGGPPASSGACNGWR